MVVGYVSDIGKSREKNQDAFYASKDRCFPLYIVADGMGGHRAGEIASTMARNIIESNFFEAKEKLINEDIVLKLIKKSIEEANTKIYLKSLEDAKYKGMGTTVTLSYMFKDKICIGHVGDSRAYLIRDENMVQLTEDHSFVNELLKNGSITIEEAKTHPKRNMITRAVGTSSIIEMDLKIEEYKEGDILLLCSDGLSNMLKEYEIRDVYIQEEDVQRACEILVSMANNRGGLDNITIIAIKI